MKFDKFYISLGGPVTFTNAKTPKMVAEEVPLERLLIETIRLKEKYPREIYYEVINAFRKNKAKIDFYKLNQYLNSFKNGGVLLAKIKEII